jgi:hypothetical protein
VFACAFVVPEPPGSSVAHVRPLLAEGHTVVAVDNFLTGSRAMWRISPAIRASAYPSRHHAAVSRSTARWTRAEHGVARQPQGLSGAPIETLDVGSPARATCWNWRCAKRRALSAHLHLGMLRRPAGASAGGTYWGNVNPVGPRSCYDESKRFAEALTMAYHRTTGAHQHRAHLQYLRAAHEAGRWPRGAGVYRPGPARRARSPFSATARRRAASAM